MNKNIFKSLGSIIFITFILSHPIYGGITSQIKSTKNEIKKDSLKLKKLELENSKINLNISGLKDLLIKNNFNLEKIKSQIDQSKSILKSKYSAWAPRINITSDQLPKFTTSDNRETFSENTSSNKLEPHRIPIYLYTLSSAFHSYWNMGKQNPDLKFLDTNDKIKKEKLILLKLVSNVIKIGMTIIDVDTPKKM